MQKKNAGIARNFALKGLLLLAALTLSTGFFACKVAVGGGDGGGTEAPQVTLTFDAGEGSFKEGKNLTLTGKAGENLALPEIPVREGYDLTGWNPALPEKYPEKDTEYTAVWVKEGDYTITYVNVDGATNENPASYNVETETITLKDPAKPGYTFGGWYMAEDFTGNAVTEITQGTTGNITLYAKWELESYTITYELYGGTNAPENPVSYNVETETITLKDPVKTGNTFAGWYKDGEFTTQVTEIIQGSTGNITLYAKWELKNLVPETLKVEGGSCTLNDKEVTLSSFWISPYEVTQEEFVSVMTGNQNGIKSNPSYFQGDNNPPAAGEVQAKRPVEQVNWYDAIVYCNLLSMREDLTPCYTIKGSTNPADWGASPTSYSYDADWDRVTCNFNADGYRLPTEAEWGGGQPGITDGSWEYEYSGSGTIDEVAWYRDNSNWMTHEVGKKKANTLGLYDMSGNVWEWCWDRVPIDDSYPSGTKDPTGPDTGYDGYRVQRGGCWCHYASGCTVLHTGGVPDGADGDLGFRVVRSIR